MPGQSPKSSLNRYIPAGVFLSGCSERIWPAASWYLAMVCVDSFARLAEKHKTNPITRLGDVELG